MERFVPVTEDPLRTRRRLYRVADNFLAFWLGLLAPRRAEIERGLGNGILTVLLQSLDDYMGARFEEAFRLHLRRLAQRGELGSDVVAIGPFWTASDDPSEIDAVVLAGRGREAVLVGECRWSARENATRMVQTLQHKVHALPKVSNNLEYAVCTREPAAGQADRVFTAADLFSA